MMLKNLGKRPVTSAPTSIFSFSPKMKSITTDWGLPKGMELHPILTPTTDRVNPKAAKKQPARAAGPQKRSKMALRRSHWFQYACPNFPWTAAVAPMPKKKIRVLLAKIDEA